MLAAFYFQHTACGIEIDPKANFMENSSTSQVQVSVTEFDERSVSSAAPVVFVVTDQNEDFAIAISPDAGTSWAAPVVEAAQRTVQLAQAIGAAEDVATGSTLSVPEISEPSLERFSSYVFGPSLRSGLTALLGFTTDAASLLQVQTWTVLERRNPNVNEPVLQGRRLGQLAANGSYWIPARQDLDTMLSKIDSELVSRVITVKGPYSTLYGPGFSFYDVQLIDAPRYATGFESHARSKFEYQTNGAQWHARQSVWGGSTDWGVRAGYGHRGGSDYETGDSFSLPTSYNSGTADFSLGLNVTEDDRLDFTYLRLDQRDLEFPGQFYDINALATNGYTLKYVRDNGIIFDRMTSEGWYNETRFQGDTTRSGKQRQVPFIPNNNLESNTFVSSSSAGYRSSVSWDADRARWTAGSDLRVLRQELTEITTINGGREPDAVIPPASSANPGLFVEGTFAVSDRLSITTGGRVDLVNTKAVRQVDLNGNGFATDLENELGGVRGGDFDREFELWAAHVSAEFDLAAGYSLSAKAGHAMRPPTMTELYAYQPFVAVLPQLAFTTLFGNPGLNPEKIWQIDLGLNVDYQWIRGGVNTYHAWIDDYISFDFVGSQSPLGLSPFYAFINTEHATLWGADVFGECDINDCFTAFATFSYVEGRDHTRSVGRAPACAIDEVLLDALCDPRDPRSGALTGAEPLPVIPPLNSQIGIRIHDPCPEVRWSLEFVARIVDNQDRVATSLQERETPGFATFHVRGRWQARDDVLLSAGIENLTDKFYQEHFDSRIGLATPVFQIGQSFYFGCEVTR